MVICGDIPVLVTPVILSVGHSQLLNECFEYRVPYIPLSGRMAKLTILLADDVCNNGGVSGDSGLVH